MLCLRPPPPKLRISPDSSPHSQKCSGLVYLVGSMCTRIVIHSVNRLFIHCSKQMHRFNVHSIRLHIGLCLEGAYLNSSAKSSILDLRRILIQRLDTKVCHTLTHVIPQTQHASALNVLENLPIFIPVRWHIRCLSTQIRITSSLLFCARWWFGPLHSL